MKKNCLLKIKIDLFVKQLKNANTNYFLYQFINVQKKKMKSF